MVTDLRNDQRQKYKPLAGPEAIFPRNMLCILTGSKVHFPGQSELFWKTLTNFGIDPRLSKIRNKWFKSHRWQATKQDISY